MSGFSSRLKTVADRMESELDAVLPVAQGGQAPVIEAMRYAVLGGGKRLRPFLLVETARMLGMETNNVWLAASALECVHVYSLIHDDLPCMDNDDFRRGKLSVHKAYDEALAVLSGDGLLTLGFEILSKNEIHEKADIRLGLIRGLAKASGTSGMIGGQVMDIYADNGADLNFITSMQAMKTGVLIEYAVFAGGLLAGASLRDQAALLQYAQALGLAFQIRDDILDAEGDAHMMGKRVGKDAELGKATFVSTCGLDKAKEMMSGLGERAENALVPFGKNADVLRGAVEFVLKRKN